MPAKQGGMVLAHVLSDAGRIGAEMTITRLADDQFYVLSAAGAELRDLDYLTQAKTAEEDVEIINITDNRGACWPPSTGCSSESHGRKT